MSYVSTTPSGGRKKRPIIRIVSHREPGFRSETSRLSGKKSRDQKPIDRAEGSLLLAVSAKGYSPRLMQVQGHAYVISLSLGTSNLGWQLLDSSLFIRMHVPKIHFPLPPRFHPVSDESTSSMHRPCHPTTLTHPTPFHSSSSLSYSPKDKASMNNSTPAC